MDMKKLFSFRLAALTALAVMVICMSAFAADAKKGLVVENGQTHVYGNSGKLIKNKPAYKVSVDGKDQYYKIDKKGVATRWKGVEEMAARQLCSLKAGGKKSLGNLKKAFKWSSSLKYQNNTNSKKKGKAAARYYGNYGFEMGRGDCNTVAYTFYWMAKVLGYPAKGIQGYVPDGSISNLQSHAWVTIKMGKTTFVFDPDFNRVYAGRFGTYCGFKIKYGAKNTYRYFSAKKKEVR